MNIYCQLCIYVARYVYIWPDIITYYWLNVPSLQKTFLWRKIIRYFSVVEVGAACVGDEAHTPCK